MAVIIHSKLCKGCKVCVKSCPFGAITVENKVAEISAACTGCNACLEDVCPFHAIEKIEDEKHGVDIHEYHGVWVFAEQRQGKLMDVAIELMGEGRRIADMINTELSAVLCGENVEGLADDLIAFGADIVYIFDAPELKSYTTDAYTKVIYEAIMKYKPEIVLLGATHIGRDLGPCLAVKCGTGLTADCTRLEVDPEDKKLMQTRPAFGGNLMATIICPNHRPQMSTVRPGVMSKPVRDDDRLGEKICVPVSIPSIELRTKILDIVHSAKELVRLTDAEIIVSGGRGLGRQEGFGLLSEFAEKLSGVIGASRAAVDSGWIDHAHQIGQTGTTVKPKIYFACGISGAIQHLAGMQEADYIVAINKNELAPIFEVADYGIVGDLYKIIPVIMEELDRQQGYRGKGMDGF